MSRIVRTCHRHRTYFHPSDGCLQCRREDNKRRQAKTKRHGLRTAHFATLRTQRLRLAQSRCELGLAGCTNRATTVHLDPRLEGNHRIATVDDCLALCLHCHGVIDGGRASRGGGQA
jgi:hypothetical protein